MDALAEHSRRAQLGQTLRAIRRARALAQEDFASISSRTYLSSLERGLQSPTVDKLGELACLLKIHPATALLLADARGPQGSFDRQLAALLRRIRDECADLQSRLPPEAKVDSS